jgi:hypothetical protein
VLGPVNEARVLGRTGKRYGGRRMLLECGKSGGRPQDLPCISIHPSTVTSAKVLLSIFYPPFILRVGVAKLLGTPSARRCLSDAGHARYYVCLWCRL